MSPSDPPCGGSSVKASHPPGKMASLQVPVSHTGGTKSQAEGLMPTPSSVTNSVTFMRRQYARFSSGAAHRRFPCPKTCARHSPGPSYPAPVVFELLLK
eukprot:155484-Prymnesium_polylepis.1